MRRDGSPWSGLWAVVSKEAVVFHCGEYLVQCGGAVALKRRWFKAVDLRAVVFCVAAEEG